MSGAREHAIAWRRGYQARVCDRLEPWAHGTVVRITELPSFYDYNLARVDGPDPGVGAERLGFRTVWQRSSFTKVLPPEPGGG
jgi:hypothetical protein